MVALEQTSKSINVFRYKPKFPIALILGNEVKGISPKILKYCDKAVYIPMFGQKESLNVSVATGVALYTVWSRFAPSIKSGLANRGSSILKARQAG